MINAFFTFKLSPEGQHTEKLMEIYQLLHGIAGMREKLLASTDNLVLRSSIASSLSSVINPNKPVDEERKKTFLETYLTMQLPHAQPCINELRVIIERRLSSVQHHEMVDDFVDLGSAQKGQQLLDMLNECESLLVQEQEFLENLQKQTNPAYKILNGQK